MDATRQSLSGAAAYRSIEAIGANPEQFMKMAIDAARTFLLQAETAISDGDQTAKAKALTSAARIVEFLLGLSGTDPGPLSDRLARVYRYVLAAILKGNAWNDPAAVAAARIAVEQLGAAWRRAFPDPITGPFAESSPAAGRGSRR
jgi:flagellar biosynthetic protein FliS